jgi:uncharacterized membrane-anchored protein
MKRLWRWTPLFVLLLAATVQAQSEDQLQIDWQMGPAIGDVGGIADIQIPQGFVFADGEDTRTLMESMQNPVNGTEKGFIAPAEDDWFVVFEFDDVGYIKDDDKDSLDADAMLASIRKGTEIGNKEREKRGWPTMTILGWEKEPYYDAESHNLEWAIRGSSEGDVVVNYNTRLLGRGGVMRVTLVADPETLTATIPKFKDLLAGYAFKPGQRYAEFRQGDKVAQYGLAALIVGGASAVAVKSGLLKYLWKILIVGFVAISAFVKKVFGRKKGAPGRP